MKLFKDYDQNKTFLLPPSLSEFVPEGHEARIISEVVDNLELAPLFAKYEGGGAPAYHPAMMFKVLIYAYSQGLYSSRSIVRQLQTNTAFMYLSGMQQPDFRTICLFRAEHADVLPDLLVEVIRMCATLGMVGLGHISFDGTKLKASASVKQTRDKKGLEKEIARIKEQMRKMTATAAELDKLENREQPAGSDPEIAKALRKKEYRLKKLQEAKEVLEHEKLEKVNVTDPESRLMKNSHKVIQPSYNGQIAVDGKEQVIVAAHITQQATDYAEFQPLVEQVAENVGELPDETEISADAGYSSYDNLEYANRKNLDLYMPDNFLKVLDAKEEGEKRYHKSNFRYDKEQDVYVCPPGEKLKRWTEQKRDGKPPLVVYRGESCGECPVKEQCTRGAARTVSRDGREPLLETMREKLRSEEGKRIYGKRGHTVEPVFGQMKQGGRKSGVEVRGDVKVNGEFSLMCLVHNVKKIVKQVLKNGVRLPEKHGNRTTGPRLGCKEGRLVQVGSRVGA